MPTYFHLIFIFSILKFSETQNVYVTTSRGQIFGFHVDNGPRDLNNQTQLVYGSGDVFYGIPYVQKPVRFQVFFEG